MRHAFIFLVSLFTFHVSLPSAHAFCGFYVAKADTKLFNSASQVALVHEDDKTVLTMANDFRGDPKEFAIVIPVPTFIKRNRFTWPRRPSSITSMPTPPPDWWNISIPTPAR
jgi:hypothetical protein